MIRNDVTVYIPLIYYASIQFQLIYVQLLLWTNLLKNVTRAKLTKLKTKKTDKNDVFSF